MKSIGTSNAPLAILNDDRDESKAFCKDGCDGSPDEVGACLLRSRAMLNELMTRISTVSLAAKAAQHLMDLRIECADAKILQIGQEVVDFCGLKEPFDKESIVIDRTNV